MHRQVWAVLEEEAVMMNHCCFSQLLGILWLFGSISGHDPCLNHTVLSDPWRNIAFSIITFPGFPLCDSHLAGLWVRFTGIGGDVIREGCLGQNICGSNYCAYIPGVTHPPLGEGSKSVTLAHRVSGHCGRWVTNGLLILACSGGYYVYNLPLLRCPATFGVRHRNCSLTFCGPRAECTGNGGCVCSSGYRLPEEVLPTNDTYGCSDIDECAMDSTICASNADCNNTVGAHNCTCNQGYRVRLEGEIASRLNPCQDFDECLEDPTICGSNATCTNNIGAHTCVCNQGYHVLLEGSIASASNPCRDIDECVKDSICGPNATCTNIPGAHTCTCYQGYRVSLHSMPSPSNLCQEIDECVENSTICGPNATCTNTAGAYTCICNQGYHVRDSIASASNPCQDVDECSENICGSNTVCSNSAGSYECYCEAGYILSTGLLWERGVTLCKSVQKELDSLTPPKGQSPGIFFLQKLTKELEDSHDIISEGIVTGVLTMALSVTDEMSFEEEVGSSSEAASAILKLSEMLVSSMVEPTDTQSIKTVRTPTMEINSQAVGPDRNISKFPALHAKGNTMQVNLLDIAKKNNGSAAAVLMSVSGMEKLMSPSFFRTENVTEMYSDIITATLPNTNDIELPEPVNFTIHHKKKSQAGLVTCVYWEDKGEEKHWSVEGCTASFSDENYTVCSCTHLSTFAILLQTEEEDVNEDDPLLEWINLVCMCVGLAFLALAIFSFLFCSWNPKINNTARLHLSICLFSAHLLFMLGVSRTENTVVCAAIAGILHFLFLSSFVWMLLETVQLFLLVRSLTKVQVIQREGLRAWYLLLIGYGVPMVVVGVSAGVFSDGYGSKEQCWLEKDKNFQWSFIGPVCSILALNLVSFCVIIWSLWPTLANMKSEVSQAKDTRLIVFKIVAQFFILGCAWILGFFQSTTVLKYLFIILNSQQGTFIFIVHCLLNKEVRQEYKRWFSCLFRAEKT
ncbi:hypothetical protein AAFF_G00179560 [Aldrovandia affinis]|uniref:Adhesion G protein-coupled receptor E1 n=1 Tax=Aldrovandia affinis TaxID=143900 RepID=A0AAD7W756_9TELE|nr:hypothetical protein AAFF_G00179560 [Aldrovandia affinis]